MSSWNYQSLSEVELIQLARETLESTPCCSKNKKNIMAIERLIYKLACKDNPEEKLNRKKYVCLIQEFIRDACFLHDKGEPRTVNDIYQLYKSGLDGPSKIGWNSELFDAFRAVEDMEIKNILTPIVMIEEGIYECPRCHQKKTRGFPVQTRRADEPTTEFLFCLNPNCNYSWKLY
jgi:DNA-directed RNA polymerase subunit M/transcription elongation factor TFIIS